MDIWPPPDAGTAGSGGRASVLWQTSELDHRADALAAPHPVERSLQAVERDPPRDEPIDRQAAVEVELGVARKVDRGHRRAVVRADDPPAAVDEREDLERRAGPEAASSRRAAPCRRSAGSRPRSRSSTAARSPRRRRPALRRSRSRIASTVAAASSPARTRIRRPELAGQIELRRHAINGDDAARAGQRGAHDGRQPDAAEPDDRDARPGSTGTSSSPPRRPSPRSSRSAPPRRAASHPASGSRPRPGRPDASAIVPIAQ